MNGTSFEILLAIIGAAAGALLGSASSILFGLFANRQQERKTVVLDLYQEYNTPPLLDDRMKVSDFLKNRQPGVSYNEIRSGFQDPAAKAVGGVTREQFEAFRRLSLYFEKVHKFKSNRYLNRKLASSMIGIYVCGWARNGWLDLLDDSTGDPSESVMFRNQHFRDLCQWFGCEKS